MNNLIKIREVSLKYDISARTLRYYEDMGLIQSTRSDDYAYRLYDENALKRLKQILILRKLNISVKDIQRIFSSNNSEVVLEVLGKKVTDIDDEVALLHELKEIVLDFIKQINESDFQKDTDVKRLYEKAKEIEQQIANVDYSGKPSIVNRLFDVAEKLEKMPDIRIIKLSQVRMARSGNNDLDGFNKWWSGVPEGQRLFPHDFMWFNTVLNSFEWLFTIPDGLSDTNGYEVFNFPGGLYAVATAFTQGEEIGRVNTLIHKWVDESEYYEVSTPENDISIRYDMGHVIGQMILPNGEESYPMDLFIPVVNKI